MVYRRIVVGTDGSTTATRAVSHAAGLAARAGAELVVVSAHDADAGRDGCDRAERCAQEGRVQALAAGVTGVDVVVAAGPPGEVLVEVATSRSADLLVTGSVGMRDTSRFVLGSVTNHVTHHATCDVLVAASTSAPTFAGTPDGGTSLA